MIYIHDFTSRRYVKKYYETKNVIQRICANSRKVFVFIKFRERELTNSDPALCTIQYYSCCECWLVAVVARVPAGPAASAGAGWLTWAKTTSPGWARRPDQPGGSWPAHTSCRPAEQSPATSSRWSEASSQTQHQPSHRAPDTQGTTVQRLRPGPWLRGMCDQV